MHVSILVGNPKPHSRTRQVAEALSAHLFSEQVETTTIDLADHTAELFDWPSDTMQELSQAVSDSDVVIVATPTYKGSYTGLLKAFLDRYPANGLAGVVAIPIFTGADQTHSMGPNVNLVPLLLELGAIVPGKGLYYNMSQHDRIDAVLADAAESYRKNLTLLAGVAQNVRGI